MKITSILFKTVGVTLFSLLLFAMYSPLAYAQSSSTIAQSFKASANQDDIVAGALVSAKSNEDTIELATLSTESQLIGVVDNNPLVSLSEEGQEVEVVLGGTTNVLVSNINGAIKSGDKITASPVAGVGMKATTESQIVGTAQNNATFTATRNITDRNGNSHKIDIGYVRVQIGITTYQTNSSNFLPPFVQDTANSIAGRQVSLIRILICSILMILGFVTVVTLAYTSARSAMVSLGRNPLAAHAIHRGLYQVGVLSLLVIGGTLLVSYLILKL